MLWSLNAICADLSRTKTCLCLVLVGDGVEQEHVLAVGTDGNALVAVGSQLVELFAHGIDFENANVDDLGASLRVDEERGRHAVDAELMQKRVEHVVVDLVEASLASKFCGSLLHQRALSTTRAAPISEEFDNHGKIALRHFSFEVLVGQLDQVGPREVGVGKLFADRAIELFSVDVAVCGRGRSGLAAEVGNDGNGNSQNHRSTHYV